MDQDQQNNTIRFESGSLVVNHGSSVLKEIVTDSLTWDPRTQQWRGLAMEYRPIIEKLTAEDEPFVDQARDYQTHDWKLVSPLSPRTHQQQAYDEWHKAGYRGTVCIPTGGGKTILAVMAICALKRSTLVVVPTIELMLQWQQAIAKYFGIETGMIGGGSHDIRPITISTYDSAHIHMEHMGNRFGFLICDECHHLPSDLYQQIARQSIAPFRLGLSATVERPDGKEQLVFKMLGPLVFEGNVQEMIGQGLSPFEVITCEIPMTPEEIAEYQAARKLYTSFLSNRRINFSRATGWLEFIGACTRYSDGPQAMAAYRKQKKLAQASINKLKEVWTILTRHVGARIIVFTDDNELAYKIGRMYMLAVLTHKTKLKERKQMLEFFKSGKISVLVTSKVLNEGVDVPEASVGVVVSGSGTVREHVQRLGRILRAQEGKQAIMYELVSQGTSELYVNKRRRDHHAYQGTLAPFS